MASSAVIAIPANASEVVDALDKALETDGAQSAAEKKAESIDHKK